MKLTQLFPSALAIAVISAVYILIAQYFQVSALWLPYIGWSAYCIAGGEPSLLPKMITGFTGGAFIGVLTVLSIGPATGFAGSTLALPLVVFFMVLLILLMELVKLIDMIPAYFFLTPATLPISTENLVEKKPLQLASCRIFSCY